MNRPLRTIGFTVLALGFLTFAIASPVPAWWGKTLPRDLAGAPIDLRAKWIVLVFLSPECPVANANIPMLNALAKEFAQAEVQLIGVYADPSIDVAALRKHAAEYQLAFPAIDDREQRIVRATGARYTPETFVYARDGQLCYRGRIDDRVTGFGAAKPVATQEDLREVIKALIAGRVEAFEDRQGFGCAISTIASP